MSEWISQWVTSTIETLGYPGIALLMFLENLFPPIPSELIMPFAGFAAAKPDSTIQFIPAVIAGIVGTVVGALPWYYLGKLVSEERIEHLADKYGKWITVTSKDIRKANEWFNKHGVKAVFFGRLVPGVRTLISLPAGINEMAIAPFLIYSTIGTTIWVTFLTAAGYLLGDNYEQVDEYLGPVSKIVAVSLVIWFVIWVVRRKNRRYE